MNALFVLNTPASQYNQQMNHGLKYIKAGISPLFTALISWATQYPSYADSLSVVQARSKVVLSSICS